MPASGPSILINPINMNRRDWIPAAQALRTLRVKPQTLYAYVSRGRLRAIDDPEDARRRLYSRHDLVALADGRARPRGRAAVAAGAIAWGEPVLESGISTVRDGELYFGRERAARLVRSMSLEAVAIHHWRCAPTDPAVSGAAAADASATAPVARQRERTFGPHGRPRPRGGPRGRAAPSPAAGARRRGFTLLSTLAAEAPASLDRTRQALGGEAAVLLSDFADAMIGRAHGGLVHERLAAHWALPAHDADMLRMALVLLSDHELNASTFAVRVAASTGASLPAAALAGFATLTGPRHGEAGRLARRVIAAAAAGGSAAGAIAEAAGAHPMAYGFGHPLYPEGDARARILLRGMRPPVPIARALRRLGAVTGHPPNIDAALAALALSRDLPDESMFTVFAIGRMAGWLAHAIEQACSGAPIRPRARFVPPPA